MLLPLGWRFSPNKIEIIQILHSLTIGKSLPGIEVYQGYDVFGFLTPSELFNATDSNTNNKDDSVGRYFYTQMKRLTKNGRNFKRTVEKINENTGKLECSGTWKGVTAADKILHPDTKALIGESRFFTFIEPSSEKWLMTMFCLAGDAVQDIPPDSDVYAICRIYKKSTKKPDVSLTTSPNYFQPQQRTAPAHPMMPPNECQPQHPMMLPNYCQPQLQTLTVNPTMSPNYCQTQQHIVTISPTMSPNYCQTQQQIVTISPTMSPNYCHPQLQTVTVNKAAEIDVNNINLYSQLDHDEKMENIEAIVDNLSFSGMNEDLDLNLSHEDLDWIDQLLTPEVN